MAAMGSCNSDVNDPTRKELIAFIAVLQAKKKAWKAKAKRIASPHIE